MDNNRWVLPEGIEELLPDEAQYIELLRREVLDLFSTWGYELVIPPFVEYTDSLLTGIGSDLDLQTFKIIDQKSGRMMGIRADMTPQVARIAAHRLRHESDILRLCYIGSVLHTLPEGQATSRNPIQLGAEIYGHAGPESDMESMQLMVELLRISGLQGLLSLDIGHVGIYRGLADAAGLDESQEQALFMALQRKASAEIEQLLHDFNLSESHHNMLAALSDLNGDSSVLTIAEKSLANAPESVQKALATLQSLAAMLAIRLPDLRVNFDLAELRGYHYHTGVVFAAYQPNSAQAIALGGRYDDIGEDFGHAQPATGFSLDLKKLVTQFPGNGDNPDKISVVWVDDIAQHNTVTALREAGQIVIYDLPGQNTACNKQLIQQNGRWQVVATGNVRG